MAKTCAITGKHSKMGGGYSNRVRATKFNPTGMNRKKANLQKKSYVDQSTGKKVTMWVTPKGMKTINKLGVTKALKKAKIAA